VILALIVQIISNRNAILQLFMEKDKLLGFNIKYAEINEELTRTIKDKDDFLLSFSHELRNPLNILLGNLELSHMTSTENSDHKYLDNAKISGELLAFLINNLLDAGKLQNRNLEVTTTPINVSSFIEKIWSVSKMTLQRKKLVWSAFFCKVHS
jgi:signal transduction histidine kinase